MRGTLTLNSKDEIVSVTVNGKATYPNFWDRDKSKYGFVVCSFCDNSLSFDAKWCPTCHEYKGIMTVEQYEDYFGVTW
jgi:hypothetical protein